MNRKISINLKRHSADENLDVLFLDERDQFDSDVDKIKSISLKILRMIDYLSKKHQFDYFLSYGTLLGAVRHKGFIPWDDDIDIMMTRKDLDKLISVAHQFPPSIRCFTHGLDFVKIMDKHSKMSIDGKRGVAVDIFVADEGKSDLSFVNVHTQKRIRFDRSDFFPLELIPFEHVQLPAPNNSDKILSTIYGDYMKLPPIEKRVSHHTNNESIRISPFPDAI